MRTYGIAILLAIALCGIAMADCCGNNGLSATIFPFNPAGCPEMPRLPHTFGGCAYIGDTPAPEGTRICVMGEGVTTDCISTGPDGCFGLGTFDPKLTATGVPVPGIGMFNVKEGTDLQFYINGERAKVCTGTSCMWTTQYHTGHHTQIILKIAAEQPCCQNK